jgi:glycosyltransferase involved in cell wall biosynthesis
MTGVRMSGNVKKLLFITWSISYGYGTEKSLADVLNRLDDTKYEISILPLFKNSQNTYFKENIRILDALIDYTAEDFDEQAALDKYYGLLASPLLFNKHISEKYDCVIACNHNAPSYFASYLKWGRKILWIRGDMKELDYRNYPEDSETYKGIKQEYDMQAKVLKSFDVIAVISDVVQRSLAELFGITENVVKISNSVDMEKITRLGAEEIELPIKIKKLFTTLGRLDYNKNQILLLKAAKELKNIRDDFCVYLLGEGAEREKLETYIDKNGLSENVKIMGFVENPYPYMKNSVATVLTSMSEGFSLVLVESVMLGTPIISTDVGVARELILKYDCGKIIDYDEKELAAVMLEYINKYDGFGSSVNVASDIINTDIGNEYDIAAEVRNTETILDKVLKQSDESPSGDKKMVKLPYPEVTINEYELGNYMIRDDYMHVLRVMKDGVPYEYLINKRNDSDKLVVFNNGAVVGGKVSVPVFQRHSWAKVLKTSAVFCMDPTLYINGYMQLGWGIGKNDNYYLENSSLILKKLIKNMGIKTENTVIFGTSAGGYLSIIMGIYLKGAKVVVDNAQLDVRKWIYKDALDAIILFCFDNIGDALMYKERFSIVEAFEKHSYVPKIYMHVNICSVADNSTQLVQFLMAAEKMKNIKEYNDVEVILHYEPDKGHDGIGMNEAVDFLYKVLDCQS